MIKIILMKFPNIYKTLKKIQLRVMYVLSDCADKENYKALYAFFDQQGNKMLRECSFLNSNSIIFELGGYRGDWISDMYTKYACNCYVFEPVKEFCDVIEKKLCAFEKVHIYNMGIGTSTYSTSISRCEDESSIYEVGGAKK